MSILALLMLFPVHVSCAWIYQGLGTDPRTVSKGVLILEKGYEIL